MKNNNKLMSSMIFPTLSRAFSRFIYWDSCMHGLEQEKKKDWFSPFIWQEFEMKNNYNNTIQYSKELWEYILDKTKCPLTETELDGTLWEGSEGADAAATWCMMSRSPGMVPFDTSADPGWAGPDRAGWGHTRDEASSTTHPRAPHSACHFLCPFGHPFASHPPPPPLWPATQPCLARDLIPEWWSFQWGCQWQLSSRFRMGP